MGQHGPGRGIAGGLLHLGGRLLDHALQLFIGQSVHRLVFGLARSGRSARRLRFDARRRSRGVAGRAEMDRDRGDRRHDDGHADQRRVGKTARGGGRRGRLEQRRRQSLLRVVDRLGGNLAGIELALQLAKARPG